MEATTTADARPQFTQKHPRSLRVRQAAREVLGVSPATFWRYAKRDGFPKLRKLSSRCTVVDLDELIAWRDAQGGSQ